MKLIAQAKDFWDKNRKVLTIVISAVLGVLFVGSLLLAIFAGGEFKTEEKPQITVKGKINVDKEYVIKTAYEVGEQFEFDKDAATVNLVAKYPDRTETERRELAGNEYGFLVNGEGDVYAEAELIVLNTEVKYISLVWKEYTNVKYDINVTVTEAA